MPGGEPRPGLEDLGARPKAHTIGDLIDVGAEVIASCGQCGRRKPADLAAMAEKLGRDHSLWNYRCRCPTPRCAGLRGWIKFSVRLGIRSESLVDRAVRWAWLFEDPRRK